MFLTLSSFCNELGAGLELVTLGCCFGPYLFLGLIGGENGRLRANVRLFLLEWVAITWNICAICTTELHRSNPFYVSATLQHRLANIFPRNGRADSLAEAELQRRKLTHDETTAHKIKTLSGIRNRMPRSLLLADYYMRDLTSC
jgi:hypothetical protein